MSAFRTEEDRRRAESAARYMIAQHGERAVAEVEAAICHALEVNDKVAIDSLNDILNALKEQP